MNVVVVRCRLVEFSSVADLGRRLIGRHRGVLVEVTLHVAQFFPARGATFHFGFGAKKSPALTFFDC